MPSIFGYMCVSSGRRSRPIPNSLSIFSPKPESAIGCALPTELSSFQFSTPAYAVSLVMKVSDFLAATDVTTDVAASDKHELLDELAHQAGAALDLRPEPILAELLKREELGSTGMGGG